MPDEQKTTERRPGAAAAGPSGQGGGASRGSAARTGGGGRRKGSAPRSDSRKGGAAAGGSARRTRRAKGRRKRAMSKAERKAALRTGALKAGACILVLAACLALALVVGTDDNQPSIVGWVPFVGCATAIVLAFAYVQVLKHSLKLMEKSSAVDVRRNEKVKFKVRFANRSPLFFFRCEAHFYTADLYGNPLNHTATTLALAPFEKYDLPFATQFDHIGTYQAGLDRVVVYDFLRLFSATLEGPKGIRVQVVPKLVDIARLEFSNDAVVETTKAARSAISDSMDYAAVREYAWGDPIKNIHWKLSARTEHYMTKLFETYNNPGVAVILDFYGPGQNALELMGMFDCVVETGFSVARHAQVHGMDSEILYCNKAGERVRRMTWRQSDLPQIVEEMPQFSSNEKRAADALGILEEQVKSVHGQSNVVVCTANLSARMVDTIIAAKVHRREPLLFAVVPKRLEGRKRDQYLAPLARLDAAGVGHVVLSSSTDLKGVK